MNTIMKIGVSLALACAAFSAPALADSASDMAALHAVDQAWLKAYNAGDADALAALYDEHAILAPPGAPAAKGRAAIRTFLGNDSAASKKAGVQFHLGANPDGGANGDLGWVSGTYSVTDSSGKTIETGKYLSVSKREKGKWLYLRDTWNSDGTPPAPAAAAKP